MARNSIHIDKVIEGLLARSGKPTREDWRALIEEHPEHLDEIVDAAILSGANLQAYDATDEAFFDKDVFDQTISKVLTLVHRMPSPVLGEVKSKIEKIQGPTVKKVATEIGIGPYPSLLSGILVGRTLPPKRVYEMLEQYLDAPVSALSEVFRRNFVQLSAPAFKATEAQPTVRTEPCSWQEAVARLNLSRSETERLMKLAE
ncbi:hypothetical protein AB4Y64_13225 [Lysobacter sp. TAF61]|uniref:hypothetical protein n=1 Tax=Lysobacter sp. TAF61 TaxID=3233072 RepID=UPI003F9B04A8